MEQAEEFWTNQGEEMTVLYGQTRDLPGLAFDVSHFRQPYIERADPTDRLQQQDRDVGQVHVPPLPQTDQQMGDFLSIVSHELRTPLATLKGSIQLADRQVHALQNLLATDAPPSLTLRLSRLTELVQRADRQTNQITTLIETLLDMARIDSDSLHLRLQPTNLATQIQSATACLPFERPEVTVTTKVFDEALYVRCDRPRIKQVITHLLANALAYAPPESTITVQACRLDGNALVMVNDQEAGIDREEVPLIWRRFYRNPEQRRYAQTGAGLGIGLYICRALIEQQGGRIGVLSKVGEGTTVWFALPSLD